MAIDPTIPFKALGAGSDNANASGGPFAVLGQLMSMRERQQQASENDLKLKQQQNAADDDDALRTTFAKHQALAGPDADPNYDYIIYDLNAQGRASAAQKLQTELFGWRQKQAEELKATAEANKVRIETASRIAQGITDDASFRRVLPQIQSLVGPSIAAQLGDHYDPDAVKSLVNQGNDASMMLDTQTGLFDKASNILERQRQAVGDAQKWQEILPKVRDEWTNIASGYLSLAKSPDDWKNGIDMATKGMAGLPSSVRDGIISQFDPQFSSGAVERARQLGMTQSQRSEEKSRQQARADAEAQNNIAVHLTPEAKRIAAQQWATTGQMVPLGLGQGAANTRDEIMNMAGDIYKNLDLPAQQAAYKALSAALLNNYQNQAQVEAFENTALANTRMFLQQAKKIIDSGSPLVNSPLRSISKQVLGSSAMASAEAARQAAVAEFGRILKMGPALGGVLSDSARNEADDLMKKDYTYKQFYDVAQTLITDAENRHKAYNAEGDAIKRMIMQPPQMNDQPAAPFAGPAVGSVGTGAPAPSRGMGGGPGSSAAPAPNANSVPKGYTRLRSPNGTVADVLNAQVGDLVAKGATVVAAGPIR